MIGCGGVGQAVVQGAHIAGAARIIAVDHVALKRDMALKLGATDVVDPNDGDVPTQILGLTSGRGADYAFEVIGNVELDRDGVQLHPRRRHDDRRGCATQSTR